MILHHYCFTLVPYYLKNTYLKFSFRAFSYSHSFPFARMSSYCTVAYAVIAIKHRILYEVFFPYSWKTPENLLHRWSQPQICLPDSATHMLELQVCATLPRTLEKKQATDECVCSGLPCFGYGLIMPLC